MNGSTLDPELDRATTRLLSIRTKQGRSRYLRRAAVLGSREGINALFGYVLHQAHVDVNLAARAAEAIDLIASRLDDNYARAQAFRAAGHIAYYRARYREAVECYDAACDIFRELGAEIETARTLSSAIQSLIYHGRYEEANARAVEARRIFEKHRDVLRLARLDSNVANILYRQDRFQEALELYQRAYHQLARTGGPQDIAAILSNLAVCYISLNEFDHALDTYREARSHCERHAAPLLVAEADYNVAYLHFLRGEYDRAIALYDETRMHCDDVGDRYHRALCDLDQGEMYLDLNLVDEAANLASQAMLRFKRLGLRYERAKAMAFLAIAVSRRGRNRRALALLAKARSLFSQERNSVWPALIDLYCALLLFDRGRPAHARTLGMSARRVFLRAGLPAKAAVAELLLARIDLEAGNTRGAARTCRAALARAENADVAVIAYQAGYLLGQICEAQGQNAGAHQAYKRAHATLEHLRSRLRGQDLKIAFLKDKLAVYESLVWMAVEGDPSGPAPEHAFSYVEQAKSRNLAELLAAAGDWSPLPRDAGEGVVSAAVELRNRLNSYYRRLELEEMAGPARSRTALNELRRRTRDCEKQLVAIVATAAAGDEEFAAFHNAGDAELAAIRSSLEPGSMIVEYYRARGTMYACLLGREALDVVPVCPVDNALAALKLLRFQLAKFRLGPEYTRHFARALNAATEAHLRSLYELLIRPVRDRLGAGHIIFVPHEFLHYVPFHALHNGTHSLIDEFAVSYAQSASTYRLCRTRPYTFEDRSLVLGVPDEATPHIADEVRAVAAMLPAPVSYLGEQASERRLRELGPHRRFIHISTHGFFRQDNPMLSSIRLGDTDLTLLDVYGMRLPAELVTLSGCGTGLNTVFAGDELVGLVRGLLYAGARSVLVSLWDVNDESTAQFMQTFYRGLQTGRSKVAALQSAMRELRGRYPHPYYWAPFTLVGDGGTTESQPSPN